MIRLLKTKLVALKTDLFDIKLPKFFSKNEFLAGLYYAFISNSFNREHISVLKGKIKHIEDSKKQSENLYLLIRNVHRIEKGLTMIPLREVFAEDYLPETINAYLRLEDNVFEVKNKQFIWFKDVLTSYFSIVKHTKTVKIQFDKFNSCTLNFENTDVSSLKTPYKRDVLETPAVRYEDFVKLNKYRRSVRWFLNKKVDRELVDKAIEVALQAPSACNRQPFQFIIIDNPIKLAEVVKIPMGTSGYSHNIQMMIVVVGNLDAYFSERDRHIIYIDASLANMTLMLALETLGLSSCAINWPDIEFKEKQMELFLGLEKHQRPIMCMAVGYPDFQGKVAFSEKRELNLIRKYIN